MHVTIPGDQFRLPGRALQVFGELGRESRDTPGVFGLVGQVGHFAGIVLLVVETDRPTRQLAARGVAILRRSACRCNR